MGEFGEKLRKQREQRGITLDAVSNTTKISTRMLKALEDERFDQLPGGVFNKGFVRAYARQVGLDADEAVSDYLAALRESQAQAQAIMPEFRAHHEDSREPSKPVSPGRGVSALDVPKFTRASDALPESAEPAVSKDGRPTNHQPPAPVTQERVVEERPHRKILEERPPRPNLEPGRPFPWGIAAGVLLVVALLLAFLSYHRRGERAAAAPSGKPVAQTQAPASAIENSPPHTDSSPALIAASPAASVAPSPSPTTSASPVASSPPSSVTTTNVAGASSPAPSSSAPPASRPPGTSSAAQLQTAPSSTSVAPSKPAPARAGNPAAGAEDASSTIPAPAPARSAAPLTLLIRAEETSWVAITVDGKPVARETLIAPAGTSVRANQEIQVHAGNAGGLVFVLNGKTLPKQGEPGEVRTFTFDANGMHVIVQ